MNLPKINSDSNMRPEGKKVKKYETKKTMMKKKKLARSKEMSTKFHHSYKKLCSSWAH